MSMRSLAPHFFICLLQSNSRPNRRRELYSKVPREENKIIHGNLLWLSAFKAKKRIFEFSLNGDGFCKFYRITRKQNKNPVTIYYLQWGWNPWPLTFLHSILLSELKFPFACRSETFRSSCSHALLILGLVGVNRAHLYDCIRI